MFWNFHLTHSKLYLGPHLTQEGGEEMLGHYLGNRGWFQPHNLSKQKWHISFTFKLLFSYIRERLLSLHCNPQIKCQLKRASFLGIYQASGAFHCLSLNKRETIKTKHRQLTLERPNSNSGSALSGRRRATTGLMAAWFNTAFHLTLWWIIKLIHSALWEMSSPQTMFNKHWANLDGRLVSVNRPRWGALRNGSDSHHLRVIWTFSSSGSISLDFIWTSLGENKSVSRPAWGQQGE